MRREVKVAVVCEQGHEAVVVCWSDYGEPFKLTPSNPDNLLCQECHELFHPAGWHPVAHVA